MVDLASAVFVLHPPRAFIAEQFMGRTAHKLFLLMMARLDSPNSGTAYSELAQSLHDRNAALPFTVSTLFQSDAGHFWMRVTALQPDLCTVLSEMVRRLPGETDVDGWTVAFSLMAQHDWAAQTTYADLVHAHDASAPARLALHFVTPTAINSVGLYRPFPDPALVFRLLYERLQHLDGVPLTFRPPVDHLEAYATYFMTVAHYNLACVTLKLKGWVTAFHGTVEYHMVRDNEAFEKRSRTRRDRDGDTSLIAIYEDLQASHDRYAALIHVLASFAFYSGVGSQTGQGLGMVRRVEPHSS